LIDFVLLIGMVPDREMMKMEVTSLTFQVAGTFLVLAATAVAGFGCDWTGAQLRRIVRLWDCYCLGLD